MKTIIALFFMLLIGQGLLAQKKLKYINESNTIRTAVVKFEKPVKLFWVLPAASSPVYNKETSFNISLRIETTYDISEKDLVLYMDDRIQPSKSGEAPLKINKRNGQDKVFFYETEVKVAAGKDKTKLRLTYKGPDNKIWSSKDMIIDHKYNVEQTTIHLLCLGVGTYNEDSELQDLKYTERDAEAIYSLFKKQENLFGEVNPIDLLVGDRATSGNVVAQVNELKQLGENGEIRKEDLILIYISSHGIVHEDDFRIATSDFRRSAINKTTVSYRTEIVDILKDIDCKKLFLIDACYSGGARESGGMSKGFDQELSQAIGKLMETPPGLTCITSSTKNEKSWELDLYQHGSFTQAVLEAFQGKADKNGNRIIDLDELFFFVKKRVAELNAAVQPKPFPKQTPSRSSNELGALPIFVIE